jgi:hypothetical protein
LDSSTILSVSLGLIGSAAGVGAAIWVYRRERAERQRAGEVARKEAATARQQQEKAAQDALRQEEQRRRVEDERRARDIRRAKHQDDYRATSAALERLKDIADRIQISGLMTSSESRETGADRLQDELERLSSKLPAIEYELYMAGHTCHEISFHALSDDVDPAIRRAIWLGINQYLGAQHAEARAQEAIAALNKEWES